MQAYIWKSLAVLLVLSTTPVQAFLPLAVRQLGANDSLSWGACDGLPPPLECASFGVPLDWADNSKGNITLALIRLPATTQPREGYMFYNPGGPGSSGLELIAGSGAKFQSQLGSSWDVLSWDPRGVGKSEPNIALFDNSTQSNQFWGQTTGLGLLDAHGNLTKSSDVDFFMSQASAFDNILQSFNTQYIAKAGEKLKYIGSAAVVRDLVAMTEAIYGQGVDINYYGISYGTRLGVYLTQLFPQRIGKVVIDGVLDADTYSNLQPAARMDLDVEDSELALRGWATYCIAAPQDCAMAAIGNGTVDGVIAAIDNILDTAYRTYDGSFPPNPTGWTFDQLGMQIYGSMFFTTGWKPLDQSLAALHVQQTNTSSSTSSNSSSTALRAKRIDSPFRSAKLPRFIGVPGYQQQETNAPNFSPEVRYAINCADVVDPGNMTTTEVFRSVVEASQNVSQHFGSLLNPRWICHRYTTRAVERLPLPMTTKPKNVVLVIGNEADPITPFSSAQSIASNAHFGSMSRLVKFKAVGHTSLSNNSTCLDNLIHAFVRGNSPADSGNDNPDAECEIDSNPFNSALTGSQTISPPNSNTNDHSNAALRMVSSPYSPAIPILSLLCVSLLTLL